MKKSIIVGLLSAVFLALGAVSYAEEVEMAPDNYMEEMRQQQKEFRAERAKEREMFKEHREEMLKDREMMRKQFRQEKGEIKAFRIEKVRAVKAERKEMMEKIQNAESPEEKRALIKEAKEKRAQMKSEIKDARKEFRGKIRVAVIKKFQRRKEIAQRRFDFVFARMHRISKRISAVIEELESKKVSVGKAKEYLQSGDKKLKEAEEKYEAVKKEVQTWSVEGLNREDLKAHAKQLKNKYKEIVALLKSARSDYKMAIKEIKNSVLKIIKAKKAPEHKAEKVEADGQDGQ